MRMVDDEHERVEVIRDPDSGLQAVIAIHSTVLGPALGGLRLRAYPGGMDEAIVDALRLSRAMTLKAAAAGLELGGGKAVMLDDGDTTARTARLRRLAEEIEALGGAYVTAEDIGTTTEDMDLLAEHTRYVVGRTSRGGVGGDPSPDTAGTVLGAMRAGLEVLDPNASLAGRTVGVVGLGKVGSRLARQLVNAGAHVVAFDPAPGSLGGVEMVASAPALLARPLDVLAPCAIGGMIDERVAEQLDCGLVCGAANNPLSGRDAAEALDRRGILYVPDFLANCGGLVHVDAERRGERDPAAVERRLAEAGERTRKVLLEARAGKRLPGDVAEERALARIEAARRRTSRHLQPA